MRHRSTRGQLVSVFKPLLNSPDPVRQTSFIPQLWKWLRSCVSHSQGPIVTHGSEGEHAVQQQLGAEARAQQFYDRQMQSQLSDRMVQLIGEQEMVFVATADANGNCDCSPRFGLAGFVRVLDAGTLAYPEYRGNGVFASLGNIHENPHAGLLFLDFFRTTVGLHVNGTARIYQPAELSAAWTETLMASLQPDGPEIHCWVVISVDEAYIHCSKHVPRLEKTSKPISWGTDDPVAKSDCFFIE